MRAPRNLLKLGAAAMAAMLVLPMAGAQAINRYESTALTGNQVMSVIEHEGEVVLHWMQAPDTPRFDRFVANGLMCAPNEEAVMTTVPTRDGFTVGLVCRPACAESSEPCHENGVR